MAWVTDSSAGKAWPINNLKSTPTLGTAVTGMSGPQGIAITPDGNTAWVADRNTGKAWPINNLKSAPALGTAVTGMNTFGSVYYSIAITPDGNTAWVVDAVKAWPINNLKTAPAFGTAITGMNNPNGIAITPDGTTAWVAGSRRWASVADYEFEHQPDAWIGDHGDGQPVYPLRSRRNF